MGEGGEERGGGGGNKGLHGDFLLSPKNYSHISLSPHYIASSYILR